MMKITLHAYEFSVYCRIVSMVCHEKAVAIDWVEINPFDEATPESYRELHPFRRVPVIEHDGFTLYETAAITGYIDEMSARPSLQPKDPRQRARMAQIIAVVDAYAYWPLVRQVFSHRVFAPRSGGLVDEEAVLDGLEKSKPVLAALEKLARGGDFLVGAQATLADFHLAAMIDYFTMAEEGAVLLGQYPKLSAWWAKMRHRDSVTATMPKF